MLWVVLSWSIGAWVVGSIADAYSNLSWLGYLVPGHQLTDLISLYGLESLTLAPIALIQTLLFLLGADQLLKRGDL